MSAAIIDRGRGPEIHGTRITVYDLLDYIDIDWSDEQIAVLFRLDIEQVRVGRQYIQDHEAEIRADYQVMLDRDARGNPPEIQALLDAAHLKTLAKLEELRARKRAEAEGAEHARADR